MDIDYSSSSMSTDPSSSTASSRRKRTRQLDHDLSSQASSSITSDYNSETGADEEMSSTSTNTHTYNRVNTALLPSHSEHLVGHPERVFKRLRIEDTNNMSSDFLGSIHESRDAAETAGSDFSITTGVHSSLSTPLMAYNQHGDAPNDYSTMNKVLGNLHNERERRHRMERQQQQQHEGQNYVYYRGHAFAYGASTTNPNRGHPG